MPDIITPIETAPTLSEPQHGDQTQSQKASMSAKPRRTDRADVSKADIVLKKLHLVRGVTVAQIMELTEWQSHSVRGFFSAVIRKKLGLNLVSEIGKDGQRRYRIVDDAAKAMD